MSESTPDRRSSRRNFLRTAVVGGGALTASPLIGACSGDDGDASAPTPSPAVGGPVARFVPFEGPHQAGVTLQPAPARGLAASFTSVADDRAALETMFRELTGEIRGLMAGHPPEVRPEEYPPTDSGVLGTDPPPDNLTIVASVGASLFDDRYGLAARRPSELVEMPFLANDRLDPARSHGDVLLTIEADHPDTIQFALRQLMRRTRRELVLKWMVDGYTRGSPQQAGETGAPRNLMGFKDGTANLDSTDAALMERYVWIQDGDDQPAWTVGGTYLAFRTIRMFVEFWDRTPLAEQEAIMGRHKDTGAPLGMDDETDEPDFGTNPDTVTPIDAHIRLANPRTGGSEENLILRRGFHYTRGFDRAGRLDQGLAFESFQRSLAKGFLAVQGRLSGEPLEEYILPEGGGFFFTLPGVESSSGYLGEGMFT